jgi:AP-2 complex subunit mu-1
MRAQESRNATMQITGAVSWRREGLKYKSNEVFLDIVESISVLMTSKGTVLRADVAGKVLMKCFLSASSCTRALLCSSHRSRLAPLAPIQGMPELKLGLNDRLGSDSAEPPSPSFSDGGPSNASGTG